MAQLKFVEKDGKPTDEALGMYSKDGEYVDFDKPCVCVGQVCRVSRKGCDNICLGFRLYVYACLSIHSRVPLCPRPRLDRFPCDVIRAFKLCILQLMHS